MDDLKKHIDQLMENKEYKKALPLIESELQQMYLPPGFEDDYHQYKQEIQAYAPAKVVAVDAVTCFTMLVANENPGLALTQLQEVPLIKHTKQIQHVFDQTEDRLVLGYLIELLIDQKVFETFVMKRDGLTIDFNPFYLESIQDNDAIVAIKRLFAEVFENDNPSLMSMCESALTQEALALLPQSVEEEDINPLGYAIIKQVLLAMHDAEQWQDLCAKNKEAEGPLLELTAFSTH
jgi:hypothetical protein